MTGALLIAAAAAVAAPVELRSGAIIEAPVVRVWPGGVEVSGDIERAIGWDDVRAVRGERAQQAEQFAAIADAAWRARTRLARGDTILAQPLFEDLFRELRGVEGPTAALAAEGLLRCKLRRGAHASAVAPWLEAARLRRAGWHGLEGRPFEGLIDQDTSLAPALCPIWLDGPALRALAADPPPTGADDPVIQEFAAWYAHAARLQAGLPTAAPPRGVVDHPGVRLVADIAQALDRDAETRAAARDSLRAALDESPPPWREAWIRAALGKSLLMEPDTLSRDRGLIELFHLPARVADEQPYLAGLALAVASVELRQRGRTGAADSLLSDLRASSLRHPALRWAQSRRAGGAAATRTEPSPKADNDP